MFFNDYSKALKEAIDQINTDEIKSLYDLLDAARKNGKNVFVLGNGGSAASASHWVCDFGKGINTESSKRMKIVAPADNLGMFSALGNDYSYDQTFAEQLKGFLGTDDLVISLSVSGNSSNLLEGHRYAKKAGAKTVCIVGDLKGKLIELSDLAIVIKSDNYGIVEDIHMIVDHAVSQHMRFNNEKT